MVKAPDFGMPHSREQLTLEIGSSNLPWVVIISMKLSFKYIFASFGDYLVPRVGVDLTGTARTADEILPRGASS
jgi:hypothetical protein